MAEMSKTARASMGKVEKKEKVVETQEESIRQLRLNLDAGLYVTPDRIRVLLTAYDQRGEELQAYLKLGKMAQDMNTISRAIEILLVSLLFTVPPVYWVGPCSESGNSHYQQGFLFRSLYLS